MVGRGGFHALRDWLRVIRIFIHAPKEFRVNQIMVVRKITDVREARAEVEESDRRRAKLITHGWGPLDRCAKSSLNYRLKCDRFYHECRDGHSNG